MTREGQVNPSLYSEIIIFANTVLKSEFGFMENFDHNTMVANRICPSRQKKSILIPLGLSFFDYCI